MYTITAGIPKPASVKTKPPGSSKYPLAEMKVGDSFVVPYGDMNQDETAEQFRNRIYKSARNYALKDYNDRKGAANGPDEIAKKQFTAAVMTADDENDPKRFVTGDVVVWRDA